MREGKGVVAMNGFKTVVARFCVVVAHVPATLNAFGSARPSAGPSLLTKQPMHFEENHGQWQSSTKFVARKGKVTAILESGGISIREGAKDLLRIAFEGASPAVTIAGEEWLSTHYNYYV